MQRNTLPVPLLVRGGSALSLFLPLLFRRGGSLSLFLSLLFRGGGRGVVLPQTQRPDPTTPKPPPLKRMGLSVTAQA
ncbi:hypothetical protein NVSP9465_00504 [Novosphingobium sp. CECT 9465]|nr:hypothetical protein NVSP9465_00504 [Novosphingobium sp. CECT 9465]